MPSDHSNDNSTELNCSLDERGNSAAAGAEKALAELDQRYPFVPKVATRAVVLSDPKWCDQVLRARPEIFTRDSGIAPVASEIGVDGVFSAEGDAWRPQRRLAMLALAQRH